MSREVLLTGSVPREPASSVFGLLQQYLGPYLRRMPDGEQKGWGGGRLMPDECQDILEPGPSAPMVTVESTFSHMRMQMLRFKPGVDPSAFTFPPSGVGQIKIESYRQFRQLKDAGQIPAHVRFQATLPSPATAAGRLFMSPDIGVRAAAEMTVREVEQIVQAVPAEELAVQLDLAIDVEMEEVRRRPNAFHTPYFGLVSQAWGDWTMEQIADSVARVAEVVPTGAELGFHLCGMWHVDSQGGQDMQVHVDWANLLTRRVKRSIDYLHVASIPEHGDEDYRKLRGLDLEPHTRLFIGLIHPSDGLEGARRRVASAAKFGNDFGVGHFCGLFPIFKVDQNKLEQVLELHAQVAQL